MNLTPADASADSSADASAAAVPPGDRRHFRRLDGLRGVAILMVVAFHCFGQTYGLWQLPWRPGGVLATIRYPAGGRVPTTFLALYPFTFGWAGVALFFVLSGFVIHHSQLRAGRFSPAAFAWRRAARIVPPYLLAVVVFTAVAWFVPGFDHRDLVKQFALHAVLLHNLRPSTFLGLNGAFWSLAVEAQMYALYPVLLGVRRLAGPRGALAGAAVVSAGAVARAAAHTDWHRLAAVPTFVWWNTLPLWFTWALGMYLAEEFAAGRRAFARPAVWGPALAAAFVAATFAKPTWAVSFTLAAGAAAVATEAALWSPRWDWLGGRWLVAAGLCSYSVYLWHQPLVWVIATGFARLRWPPAVQFAAVSAVTAVVAGAVGWGLYVAVERPCQTLARRFPRRP